MYKPLFVILLLGCGIMHAVYSENEERLRAALLNMKPDVVEDYLRQLYSQTEVDNEGISNFDALHREFYSQAIDDFPLECKSLCLAVGKAFLGVGIAVTMIPILVPELLCGEHQNEYAFHTTEWVPHPYRYGAWGAMEASALSIIYDGYLDMNDRRRLSSYEKIKQLLDAQHGKFHSIVIDIKKDS